MKDTKLIFIDGITGSGKSIAAHYITRQFKKNGIKAKWLYEEEDNHPLENIIRNENESDSDYIERFLHEMPIKWKKFLESIKPDSFIYIIDSFLFQDFLRILIGFDIQKEDIFKFALNLYNLVQPFNPKAIFFYQDNLEKHLRRNFKRRGNDWKEWLINEESNKIFCKNRNLTGEEAVLGIWNELFSISLELFESLQFSKIKIENYEQEWSQYYDTILDFIQLQKVTEKYFDDSFKEYVGQYSGFPVNIRDKRLCIDFLYDNVKLLPQSKDEFELEGFPVSIKFIRNSKGSIKLLEFINNPRFIIYGPIRNKYPFISISKEIVDKYCGSYICLSEKTKDEIVVKNNQLYYIFSDGYKVQLFICTDELLCFKAMDGNIKFNLLDGKIEYVIKVENDTLLLFEKIQS